MGCPILDGQAVPFSRTWSYDLLMCVSLRLLSCLAICCPACVVAQETQTALSISTQTTHITEPLDERGFVDYVKAVNQMPSRGVDVDNNFEVVFRQVLGPNEIPEPMREAYYQGLGILISDGDFFVSYSAFKDAQGRVLSRPQYDRAYDAPWTAEDLPDVARWLASVSGKLDQVVQGSQRDRYYTPYLADAFEDSEDAYPRMISMLLPSIQGQRELARSLRIRVNLHLKGGDLDAAWRDVMTIYRMSRLIATGITLIEELVGIALDGIAFNSAVDVLQSSELTDQQVRRYLADLLRLKPLPAMAGKIDVGERFMGLDAVQTLATQPDLIKTLNLIDSLSLEQQPQLETFVEATAAGNGTTLVVFQKQGKPSSPSGINWDVTATMLNQWYDRIVAAAGEDDFQKRRAAFKKIESDMEEMRKSITDSPAALQRVLAGKQEDEVGRAIGKILVALLMPAIEAVSRAEYEARARLDVLQLACAAEVYRRDTGVFPAQPDRLLPHYLREIPQDPMSGKALRYKAIGQRLLLYSVGRNGKDNLGLSGEN